MNHKKLKTVQVSADEENYGRLKEKSVANNVSRKPLGDLSGNILQKKTRVVRKSCSAIKTVEIKDGKPRSNSTSDVEAQVSYYFKCEKVTERRSVNQDIGDEEEVFVSGEQHFINYVAHEKYAKIVSGKPKTDDVEAKITHPMPVVRITAPNSVKAEIKRPAQKVNLVRRLSNRHRRCKLDELYANGYYDADYFEDNYQYMLDMEKKYVFRRDVLQKNIDENYRMVVVNWLTYVQQILDLAEHTFFVGVRLFDYILLKADVPNSKYTLVGITCFWIANKYVDVHFIQAPKLFSICNGKFSRKEFITMEKEILKVLKFNVNFSEPSSFLYYYLKRENLKNDPKIVYSAMFLLETVTLLLDFSSLRPSLLASLALYIVLVKYNFDPRCFLEYVESHLLDEVTFLNAAKQIQYNVKQLLKCKSVSNEVVEKYSTEDKLYVAKNFAPE